MCITVYGWCTTPCNRSPYLMQPSKRALSLSSTTTLWKGSLFSSTTSSLRPLPPFFTADRYGESKTKVLWHEVARSQENVLISFFEYIPALNFYFVLVWFWVSTQKRKKKKSLLVAWMMHDGMKMINWVTQESHQEESSRYIEVLERY